MQDTIYIIGSGASLKDFDFSKLKDLDTIAVNMAALNVPDPIYSITGDSNIFRKVQEGIFKDIKTTWVVTININHPVMKFNNGKIEHQRSKFVYNPFCVNILIPYKRCDGIGFSFDDFRSGYNSGFCGLQFAVLLNYKKIYLLGFDLTKINNQQHYHDYYKGKQTISDANMEKFFINFKLALNILKEKNIQVISCSETSRLNSIIEYQSFESTL